MTKNRETLSEFNARIAKERGPIPKLRQLAESPGKPDLEKLMNLAASRPEPTYKCPKCLDVGWLIDTRPGPKQVYGAKPRPVAYGRRCGCKKTSYRDLQPTTQDEIPI